MKKEEDPELPGTEDLSDPFKKKPPGMPPLSEVRSEALRMGLKETDAEFIYADWVAYGFKTKRGPIKDWRMAMRVWWYRNWFPSQKKDGYRLSKPQQEAAERTERLRRARDGR